MPGINNEKKADSSFTIDVERRRMLPSSSSSEPSSTVAQPIINKLSYTSLNISVDNFALLRASLACMHAKVLNTIKRKDVGDRTKIDIIFNLMKG